MTVTELKRGDTKGIARERVAQTEATENPALTAVKRGLVVARTVGEAVALSGGVGSPTMTDLRYDAILGNISLAYEQADLVNERIVPVVPVGARQGKFPKWGLEAFRVHRTLRVPRTRANEITHRFTWVPFATEQHRLLESVAKEEREEAENIPGGLFNLEREAVETATASLDLGREKRVAQQLRATGLYPSDVTLTGTAKWSDPASNPFTQVRAAKASVRANVGRPANVMVAPYDVKERLKIHPAILSELSNQQRRIATDEDLRELFGINEIIVPEVIENTANEGQTPVLADLWSDDVILAYRNPQPGRRRMSLAYTFRYRRPGGPVRRWREEDRETDFFEVGYEERTYIVAPGAGAIIRDTL
jgi:hypothetical protein